MKTRIRSFSPTSIQRKRWAAYAAAGAATALAGTNSAEAAIHYSGRLDATFPREGDTAKTLQLDRPGDSLAFAHYGKLYAAYFSIVGIVSDGFMGRVGFDIRYLSKLSFGRKISAGFINTSYPGLMAFNSFGDWADPGIGYVGFSFNNGAGRQYGWARVRMGGSENKDAFRVLEFAYGDPGEPVTAGQRTSRVQAPDQSSLGWLAVGAIGLLAWRMSRSRAPRQTMSLVESSSQ